MEGPAEYIADSEDEDMLIDPSFDLANTSTAGMCQTESVHTASTSLYSPAKNLAGLSQPTIAVLPEAANFSSSSNSIPSKAPTGLNVGHHAAARFNSSVPDPSVTSAAEPPKGRPRPKPRPAYKVTGTHSNAIPASATTSNISDFSNHEPAGSSLPPPKETIIEWSSGSLATSTSKQVDAQPSDISAFSEGASERAKMRARAKVAEKTKKSKAIVESVYVIELTSSEDELSTFPSSKAKTKAKGKTKEVESAPITRRSPKRAKFAQDVEGPASTIATIPVPTSDFPMPSSMLPPSDPPVPSSSSVPPTSNPALAPSPPSSPLPAVRKRKRPSHITRNEDDEDDDLGLISPGNKRDSQKLMPPPPVPNVAPAPTSSTRTPVAQSEGARKPASPSAVKEPAKPKAKSRKKKAVEDEEEDWAGDAKPKAKRKGRKKDEGEGDTKASRGKTKPASAKGKEKAVPRAIVEVVLERRSSISPKKARMKEDTPPMIPGPSKGDTPDSELTELGEDDVENSGLKAAEGSSSNSTRPEATIRHRGKAKGKGKATRRAVVSSDDEDQGPQIREDSSPAKAAVTEKDATRKTPPLGRKSSLVCSNSTPDTPSKLARAGSFKENDALKDPSSSLEDDKRASTSKAPSSIASTPVPRSSSVIPKLNTPMSELIRRVNSKPGSPFASPRPTYSPYTKSSKSMLKRIAPLHPNRRTPPPPPPRPPPPKKTKKQLEMEEQWEMELQDTVEGWTCLSEEERAALRRAKRDAVMGFDD